MTVTMKGEIWPISNVEKEREQLGSFFFRPSDGERVRERDRSLTDDGRERKDR